ncbi:hypothetical protein FIBSPDRAFT_881903 [Athelia psychrophila]|uniref:Uncharacterized protein n=1 Tax=Athelia psychrophila TaxID=1759441 RepID=A0A166VW79_9AGAM|nr:hypothetical protein FIBSPDRAFT_881903 [Fibularhizoctonia sp. CBS 109695]
MYVFREGFELNESTEPAIEETTMYDGRATNDRIRQSGRLAPIVLCTRQRQRRPQRHGGSWRTGGILEKATARDFATSVAVLGWVRTLPSAHHLYLRISHPPRTFKTRMGEILVDCAPSQCASGVKRARALAIVCHRARAFCVTLGIAKPLHLLHRQHSRSSGVYAVLSQCTLSTSSRDAVVVEEMPKRRDSKLALTPGSRLGRCYGEPTQIEKCRGMLSAGMWQEATLQGSPAPGVDGKPSLMDQAGRWLVDGKDLTAGEGVTFVYEQYGLLRRRSLLEELVDTRKANLHFLLPASLPVLWTHARDCLLRREYLVASDNSHETTSLPSSAPFPVPVPSKETARAMANTGGPVTEAHRWKRGVDAVQRAAWCMGMGGGGGGGPDPDDGKMKETDQVGKIGSL